RLLAVALEGIGDRDPELGERADATGRPPRARDRLGEGATGHGVAVGQRDAGLVDALDRAHGADEPAAERGVERDQQRKRRGREGDAGGGDAAERDVGGELAVAHARWVLDLAVAADVDQLALAGAVEVARD